MAAAAPRPRLPDAVSLALPRGEVPVLWRHGVRLLEAEGFERMEIAGALTRDLWERESPQHAAPLHWRMEGGSAALWLTPPWPSLRRTKWPDWLPDPIVRLTEGETVRIDWNARFASSAGGSNRAYFFEEHRYWIGLSAHPSADLFLAADPRKCIDLKVAIY